MATKIIQLDPPSNLPLLGSELMEMSEGGIQSVKVAVNQALTRLYADTTAVVTATATGLISELDAFIFSDKVGNDGVVINSGGSVEIYHSGVLALETDAIGGILLSSGVAVNEFSIDGTLSGDSDIAVPTEKAVKTYVDRVPILTSEPTGYPNRTDSAIAMGAPGPANRFEISPTGGSFDYYIAGVKYTKIGTDTIDISDAQGLHYIFYDGATLTESLVFDPIFLQNKAFTAVVYWDTTANIHIYMGDERHGLVMDWATHSYLHATRGTVWNAGLALTDIVADGTGDTNIDCQFGYTQGIIYDEDLRLAIGEELSPATLPVFYQYIQTGEWRQKVKDVYPVLNAGSTPDYSGTRIAYNDFDGSEWSLVECVNDGYVLMHWFATNDPDQGVIGIVGQNEYTTLEEAHDGAKVELESLILTDLPFVEFTAIATTINKTSDSFTNVPKAAIVSTDTGSDYIDWRGVQGQSRGSVAVSDHGNLTGLASDDHMQYSLASGTRSFAGPVSGITPVIDSHLTTKLYVDNQIGGGVSHNSTLGLQGGDSTADEFFHLTQAIHDGLFSGSPIIGLGNTDVTYLKVDYGSYKITMSADGRDIFTGYDGTQTLGRSGNSRIVIDQSAPSADIYVGSAQVLDLDAETQVLGIAGDSRVVVSQADDTVDIYAGATQVADLRPTVQIFGIENDSSLRVNQTGTFILELNNADHLYVSETVFRAGYLTDTNLEINQTGTGNFIFKVNDTSPSTIVMTVDTDGVTLKTGASVNEFSIDGTLVDDSDDAVPTEKAVKTYVDNAIGGLTSDHNDLTDLQGGDATALEFYHLTQDIYDGLYSGSPLIGLGKVLGTNIEVDYGSDQVSIDVGGTNVLSLGSSLLTFGTVGDTYIALFPTADTIQMIAGGLPYFQVKPASQFIGEQSDTNMLITQASHMIEFESEDTVVATINTDGLSLQIGTSINEFSIDGTMAGDSDDAVPTEKAVKTYVDTQVVNLMEPGNVALSNGDTTADIVFLQQQGSIQYSQAWSLEYTGGGFPSHYLGVVFDKTVDGFKVLFSGEIDSDDYILSWVVIDALIGSSSSSSSSSSSVSSSSSSSSVSSSSSTSSSSSSSTAAPLGVLNFIDQDFQGDNYTGVWGDGNFIYAACQFDGLRSYSVDGGGNLTFIDVDDQGDVYVDVWGDGNFIYVACGVGGLRSYSVDGGGNLTFIDSDYQGASSYTNVWGDGNFIYVGNSGEGIRSYSVDGGGNLTFIDVDNTGDFYRGINGDGNFIYAACSGAGLRSYSVDGGGNLTAIDIDDQGSTYREVWVDGSYIYVACDSGGLRSYSVDGGGNLTFIDANDQGNSYRDVWGDGSYILTACWSDGIRSHSVDGSGNLTFLDADDQGDFYWSVWGDGNFIYTACGAGGLRSYTVTP